MNKIKLIFASIWLLFISAISPVWIGITYMNITGHGKGYAYDMGSEADIAIIIGVFLLLLWLISLLPIMVWLSMKLYRLKKHLLFIPLLAFAIIFIVSILIIGWSQFIAFFGVGFNRFTR